MSRATQQRVAQGRARTGKTMDHSTLPRVTGLADKLCQAVDRVKCTSVPNALWTGDVTRNTPHTQASLPCKG